MSGRGHRRDCEFASGRLESSKRETLCGSTSAFLQILQVENPNHLKFPSDWEIEKCLKGDLKVPKYQAVQDKWTSLDGRSKLFDGSGEQTLCRHTF